MMIMRRYAELGGRRGLQLRCQARVCKTLVAVLVLAIALTAHGAAGTLEDADVAKYRGQYATALNLYHQASEEGDVRAPREIGAMYLLGKGVPQNNFEALKWYQQAAERGDAFAQQMVGGWYWAGELLPLNHAEAAKWFSLAAKQGEHAAQYRLAEMYFIGTGVPQNFMEAYFWSSLAAADLNLAPTQTKLKAIELRNNALRYLTADQVAEAQRQAAEFRPKNSVVGAPRAFAR